VNLPRPPQTWVVGSREDVEFQPLVEWLSTMTAVQFATGRETSQPEARMVPASEGAMWVVFLSPRPSSVSRETVERWQRWLPLACFVVVLGSWCEGELRTGRPWPGVTRVYWHQILPRLMAPIADADDLSAEWRLPRTATEPERLVATLPRQASDTTNLTVSSPPADVESIAAWSATTLGWDTIADACRAGGWAPIRWTTVNSELPEGTRAVVIDMQGSFDAAEPIWRTCAWRSQGVPALALVGFPRWEDRVALEQLGVGLLSKPWRLVDFQRQLSELLHPATSIRGGGEV